MLNYKWFLKDINAVEKNGLKVFSCFSCGGGSSLGYKLAGFEVIGNCEIDPAMNKLYLENLHPKYNFLMGVQDFKKLENIPEELFGIDVLDGSPPCSTFSLAGEREKNWGKDKKFREGQAAQVLSDLFFEFLDVAEVLKPKVIIAENVKGIIQGNAKSYINAIIKRYNSIGYDVQIFLLNSATMGVPQKRERVFFIARRKDLNYKPVSLKFNERPILYKEFKDSEYKPLDPDSQTAKRWANRKVSDRTIGDVVARTEKGKLSGFTLPFIKDNEVPPTLTAGGSVPLRFDVCASISDKDMITIQTFPQDYNFLNQSVQYVCGMSVPPLMMAGIAQQVYKQVFDSE